MKKLLDKFVKKQKWLLLFAVLITTAATAATALYSPPPTTAESDAAARKQKAKIELKKSQGQEQAVDLRYTGTPTVTAGNGLTDAAGGSISLTEVTVNESWTFAAEPGDEATGDWVYTYDVDGTITGGTASDAPSGVTVTDPTDGGSWEDGSIELDGFAGTTLEITVGYGFAVTADWTGQANILTVKEDLATDIPLTSGVPYATATSSGEGEIDLVITTNAGYAPKVTAGAATATIGAVTWVSNTTWTVAVTEISANTTLNIEAVPTVTLTWDGTVTAVKDEDDNALTSAQPYPITATNKQITLTVTGASVSTSSTFVTVTGLTTGASWSAPQPSTGQKDYTLTFDVGTTTGGISATLAQETVNTVTATFTSEGTGVTALEATRPEGTLTTATAFPTDGTGTIVLTATASTANGSGLVITNLDDDGSSATFDIDHTDKTVTIETITDDVSFTLAYKHLETITATFTDMTLTDKTVFKDAGSKTLESGSAYTTDGTGKVVLNATPSSATAGYAFFQTTSPTLVEDVTIDNDVSPATITFEPLENDIAAISFGYERKVGAAIESGSTGTIDAVTQGNGYVASTQDTYTFTATLKNDAAEGTWKLWYKNAGGNRPIALYNGVAGKPYFTATQVDDTDVYTITVTGTAAGLAALASATGDIQFEVGYDATAGATSVSVGNINTVTIESVTQGTGAVDADATTYTFTATLKSTTEASGTWIVQYDNEGVLTEIPVDDGDPHYEVSAPESRVYTFTITDADFIASLLATDETVKFKVGYDETGSAYVNVKNESETTIESVTQGDGYVSPTATTYEFTATLIGTTVEGGDWTLVYLDGSDGDTPVNIPLTDGDTHFIVEQVPESTEYTITVTATSIAALLATDDSVKFKVAYAEPTPVTVTNNTPLTIDDVAPTIGYVNSTATTYEFTATLGETVIPGGDWTVQYVKDVDGVDTDTEITTTVEDDPHYEVSAPVSYVYTFTITDEDFIATLLATDDSVKFKVAYEEPTGSKRVGVANLNTLTIEEVSQGDGFVEATATEYIFTAKLYAETSTSGTWIVQYDNQGTLTDITTTSTENPHYAVTGPEDYVYTFTITDDDYIATLLAADDSVKFKVGYDETGSAYVSVTNNTTLTIEELTQGIGYVDATETTYEFTATLGDRVIPTGTWTLGYIDAEGDTTNIPEDDGEVTTYFAVEQVVETTTYDVTVTAASIAALNAEDDSVKFQLAYAEPTGAVKVGVTSQPEGLEIADTTFYVLAGEDYTFTAATELAGGAIKLYYVKAAGDTLEITTTSTEVPYYTVGSDDDYAVKGISDITPTVPDPFQIVAKYVYTVSLITEAGTVTPASLDFVAGTTGSTETVYFKPTTYNVSNTPAITGLDGYTYSVGAYDATTGYAITITNDGAAADATGTIIYASIPVTVTPATDQDFTITSGGSGTVAGGIWNFQATFTTTPGEGQWTLTYPNPAGEGDDVDITDDTTKPIFYIVTPGDPGVFDFIINGITVAQLVEGQGTFAVTVAYEPLPVGVTVGTDSENVATATGANTATVDEDYVINATLKAGVKANGTWTLTYEKAGVLDTVSTDSGDELYYAVAGTLPNYTLTVTGITDAITDTDDSVRFNVQYTEPVYTLTLTATGGTTIPAGSVKTLPGKDTLSFQFRPTTPDDAGHRVIVTGATVDSIKYFNLVNAYYVVYVSGVTTNATANINYEAKIAYTVTLTSDDGTFANNAGTTITSIPTSLDGDTTFRFLPTAYSVNKEAAVTLTSGTATVGEWVPPTTAPAAAGYYPVTVTNVAEAATATFTYTDITIPVTVTGLPADYFEVDPEEGTVTQGSTFTFTATFAEVPPTGTWALTYPDPITGEDVNLPAYATGVAQPYYVVTPVPGSDGTGFNFNITGIKKNLLPADEDPEFELTVAYNVPPIPVTVYSATTQLIATGASQATFEEPYVIKAERNNLVANGTYTLYYFNDDEDSISIPTSPSAPLHFEVTSEDAVSPDTLTVTGITAELVTGTLELFVAYAQPVYTLNISSTGGAAVPTGAQSTTPGSDTIKVKYYPVTPDDAGHRVIVTLAPVGPKVESTFVNDPAEPYYDIVISGIAASGTATIAYEAKASYAVSLATSPATGVGRTYSNARTVITSVNTNLDGDTSFLFVPTVYSTDKKLNVTFSPAGVEYTATVVNPDTFSIAISNVTAATNATIKYDTIQVPVSVVSNDPTVLSIAAGSTGTAKQAGNPYAFKVTIDPAEFTYAGNWTVTYGTSNVNIDSVNPLAPQALYYTAQEGTQGPGYYDFTVKGITEALAGGEGETFAVKVGYVADYFPTDVRTNRGEGVNTITQPVSTTPGNFTFTGAVNAVVTGAAFTYNVTDQNGNTLSEAQVAVAAALEAGTDFAGTISIAPSLEYVTRVNVVVTYKLPKDAISVKVESIDDSAEIGDAPGSGVPNTAYTFKAKATTPEEAGYSFKVQFEANGGAYFDLPWTQSATVDEEDFYSFSFTVPDQEAALNVVVSYVENPLPKVRKTSNLHEVQEVKANATANLFTYRVNSLAPDTAKANYQVLVTYSGDVNYAYASRTELKSANDTATIYIYAQEGGDVAGINVLVSFVEVTVSTNINVVAGQGINAGEINPIGEGSVYAGRYNFSVTPLIPGGKLVVALANADSSKLGSVSTEEEEYDGTLDGIVTITGPSEAGVYQVNVAGLQEDVTATVSYTNPDLHYTVTIPNPGGVTVGEISPRNDSISIGKISFPVVLPRGTRNGGNFNFIVYDREGGKILDVPTATATPTTDTLVYNVTISKIYVSNIYVAGGYTQPTAHPETPSAAGELNYITLIPQGVDSETPEGTFAVAPTSVGHPGTQGKEKIATLVPGQQIAAVNVNVLTHPIDRQELLIYFDGPLADEVGPIHVYDVPLNKNNIAVTIRFVSSKQDLAGSVSTRAAATESYAVYDEANNRLYIYLVDIDVDGLEKELSNIRITLLDGVDVGTGDYEIILYNHPIYLVPNNGVPSINYAGYFSLAGDYPTDGTLVYRLENNTEWTEYRPSTNLKSSEIARLADGELLYFALQGLGAPTRVFVYKPKTYDNVGGDGGSYLPSLPRNIFISATGDSEALLTFNPGSGQGITTDGNFTFTVTPTQLIPGYEISLLFYKDWLTVSNPPTYSGHETPDVNGVFTITLTNIKVSDLQVVVGYRQGVGNANVDADKVWANGNTLFINSTTNGIVKVYSIAGSLVKTVKVEANTLTTAELPQGTYIVTLNGKTTKVNTK
jgi:hypothetical protein